MILPPRTDVTVTIPRASKVPAVTNVNPWDLRYMPPGATPASMTQETVRPTKG